jgi:uncharacterized membrane protein
MPLALGGALAYWGKTRHCPIYQAAGIDHSQEPNSRSVVVTIQRPPVEVYRFCSDMRNFPQFVSFLRQVRPERDNQYRWTVQAPGGQCHEWTVELYEQSEPYALKWRTLEDAPLRVHGSFEFESAPANRGTRVRATAQIGRNGRPGLLASLIKPIAGHKLRHDLGQLKKLMEAGEVITVKGQTSGRERRQIRGAYAYDLTTRNIPGTQPILGHPARAEAAAHS